MTCASSIPSLPTIIAERTPARQNKRDFLRPLTPLSGFKVAEVNWYFGSPFSQQVSIPISIGASIPHQHRPVGAHTVKPNSASIEFTASIDRNPQEPQNLVSSLSPNTEPPAIIYFEATRMYKYYYTLFYFLCSSP